jgi:hypothetical protein
MLRLPNLTECTSVDGEGATVIAACGFEDRTLALGKAVVPGTIEQVCLLVYRNWHEENRVSEVEELYQNSRSASTITLDYDRFIPDSFGNILLDALHSRSVESVILDISTMSKMAILVSLEICRELNIRTRVFYSEAAEYGPTLEQYQQVKKNPEFPRPSIQIYSGVAGLARASRLSSVSMQGEPSAAIAFMSMNEMLTQALLSALYPSRLFLINGRPPIHRWREGATAWIHEQLIKEWPEEDNPSDLTSNGELLPRRSTSTLDYRETTEVICDLYWQLALNYRIILAPTGAKMQTVGSFIARAMHPDIHVEYPTPKGFLDFYSRGIASRWIVDFGKIGDFVQQLRIQDMRKHLAVLGNERP